jgi:hypothetical protein
MRFTHGFVEYVLPDEWWVEAGMQGSRPPRRSFRVNPDAACGLPVLEVLMEEVEPLQRQLSHGVFNDSPEFGTARERVVRILCAFRDDVPLPPIEVVRAPAGGWRFRLSHGAHRFYCAVAAGFSAVPAIDVTDELAKLG